MASDRRRAPLFELKEMIGTCRQYGHGGGISPLLFEAEGVIGRPSITLLDPNGTCLRSWSASTVLLQGCDLGSIPFVPLCQQKDKSISFFVFLEYSFNFTVLFVLTFPEAVFSIGY